MTNDKFQISNKCQNQNSKSSTEKREKKYDLEERTAKFGEMIIEFAKCLPRNIINDQLIPQLVRSGTSVGANYMEADAAESKRDFRHKIAICKKEAKESRYWLNMISKANPLETDRCQALWSEAHELLLIFSSILLKKNHAQQ